MEKEVWKVMEKLEENVSANNSSNEKTYPGKRKCEITKNVRRKVAEVNNIPFSTEECDYDGPCSGTCPKCDAETQYLNEELQKKEARGEAVILEGLADEIIADFIDSQPSVQEDDPPVLGALDYREFGEFVDRHNVRIRELGLSLRSYHILKRAGIRTVGELCELTDEEFRQVCRQKQNVYVEILAKLHEKGLSLRALDSPDILGNMTCDF